MAQHFEPQHRLSRAGRGNDMEFPVFKMTIDFAQQPRLVIAPFTRKRKRREGRNGHRQRLIHYSQASETRNTALSWRRPRQKNNL